MVSQWLVGALRGASLRVALLLRNLFHTSVFVQFTLRTQAFLKNNLTNPNTGHLNKRRFVTFGQEDGYFSKKLINVQGDKSQLSVSSTDSWGAPCCV